MTDQETVAGIIARDNRVTSDFFYVRCRPLLTAVMRLVFGRSVDYDEMVGELYGYLMAEDGARLRQFQYRSSLYQWIKVVATRFFIRHRDNMICSRSDDALYQERPDDRSVDTVSADVDRIDVDRMLSMMANRRYADVIRRLVIEDMEPERYAAEIGVTVDNLYNIKKRAMAAFTRIALKYYSYGR